MLIAKSELWSYGEGRAQFTARRNCLNAFLDFKSTLFVMISQFPAWFYAEKWSMAAAKRGSKHNPS
jgi:hypothetical protein